MGFVTHDKVICVRPVNFHNSLIVEGEVPMVGKVYCVEMPIWCGLGEELVLVGAKIKHRDPQWQVIPIGWSASYFRLLDEKPPIDPAMLKEALDLINLY